MQPPIIIVVSSYFEYSYSYSYSYWNDTGGAIFIHEALLPDDAVAVNRRDALTPALLSLQMLFHTSQGGQLTVRELHKLLAAAGFDASSIAIENASAHHKIVVARRPLAASPTSL